MNSTRNPKNPRDTDDDMSIPDRNVKPRRESSVSSLISTTSTASAVSLSDQLKELSNNISEIASKAQMEGSTEKIEQLQNEYNSILEKAFNDAKQQVVASIKAKEEAEKEQAKQKAKENFIETMEPMITRITEELNPAEQAKMFQVIVNLTEARLNDDKMLKEFEQDPMQVKLAGEMFSRMSSIMFNHVMIQFSTLMANITEAAPVVIEQMTAVITAGCMLYNYSPLSVRQGFEGIPMIGTMFRIMNNVNPQMVALQNSSATVVAIYYLLRNCGVDMTPAIRSLGEMTRFVADACVTETTKYVCDQAKVGADVVKYGSEKVYDVLSNKMSSLMDSARAYFEADSQDSQMSSDMSSVGSWSSGSKSANTMATLKSVITLLTTPLDKGGINIELADTPFVTVQTRFEAIANNETSNPTLIGNNVSSGEGEPSSQISDLSVDEIDMAWFFGDENVSRGGRRSRRRRYYNTRKGRKMRTKRYKTRRGKRRHKTLKRYRRR